MKTFIFTMILSTQTLAMYKAYRWKNRIVTCSPNHVSKQEQVFKENNKLIKELKLIFIENKKLENQCQLIGLDGSVKKSSKKPFSLSVLEKTINSMPMRRLELKK